MEYICLSNINKVDYVAQTTSYVKQNPKRLDSWVQYLFQDDFVYFTQIQNIIFLY
jgi:hypothetical protein